MIMKIEMLEEIAKVLQQYSSLLTAEAEKLELFGVKSEPDLFKAAAHIWGLSEFVLDQKGLKLVEPIPE